MTDATVSPTVVLLFADTDLGAHLREALVALGARVVHEDSVAAVSSDTLAKSGADVIVVNLEADEEDHLDRLYEALDHSKQRVIFNDSEASRGLAGWDRARWARHLAAKVIGDANVDPPRPPAGSDESTAGTDAVAAGAPAVDAPDSAPPATHAPPANVESLAEDTAQADRLSAELEAMLAEQGVAPASSGDAASPVTRAEDAPAAAATGSTDAADGVEADAAAAQPDSASPELEPSHADDDSAPAHATAAPIAPPVTPPTPEPVASTRDNAAPVAVEQRQTADALATIDDWSLVDIEDAPAPAPPPGDSRQFGVEKVDAADYLAPEGGSEATTDEHEFDFGLEALEDTVAPTRPTDEPVSEMMLGGSTSGVRRVVAVGAGEDHTSEVGAFLAGLPANLHAVVLVVQHQRGEHVERLADALDTTTRLPVKALAANSVLRHGQVWLLPAGQQCRLRHDGRVALEASDEQGLGDPSIDQAFAALADVFGADLTAIMLAGKGYDALAGAQGVHDHGGSVWVQDPGACGDDAMASVIHGEGLADFAGSPSDLARHLCEAYA